ncbi:MAG: hypothetical protein Q9168_004600 [Polycauliona sp. 1 TL-2023]
MVYANPRGFNFGATNLDGYGISLLALIVVCTVLLYAACIHLWLLSDHSSKAIEITSGLIQLFGITSRRVHDNAAITDQSVVDVVAYRLEVDSAHVNNALTIRIVETAQGGRRGSVYEVPLNFAQSIAVRDALANAVYFNLFDWIVERINASLKARGSVSGRFPPSISQEKVSLDIFPDLLISI